MFQEIDHPIDALVTFHKDASYPLLKAFRWKGRRYDVRHVDRVRQSREPQSLALHYLVQAGADRYAIRFDTQLSQWHLEAIDIEE